MKVRFVPQNVEFEIKPGQSVLHVAQDHDIYVKSVCKGVPSCAECRVRIVEGEYNVLPPGSEELALIGTGYFIDRRRLSCQLKCFGDITVDMTEQIAKQQGLVGGKKPKGGKATVKDDRVEESHAIRGGVFDEDGDERPEPPIRRKPQGPPRLANSTATAKTSPMATGSADTDTDIDADMDVEDGVDGEDALEDITRPGPGSGASSGSGGAGSTEGRSNNNGNNGTNKGGGGRRRRRHRRR